MRLAIRLIPCLLLAAAAWAATREEADAFRAEAAALEEEILQAPASDRGARMPDLTAAYRRARDAYRACLEENPDGREEIDPILREVNAKVYWCRKFTPLAAAAPADPAATQREARAREAFERADRAAIAPDAGARAVDLYRDVAEAFGDTYWGRLAATRAQEAAARPAPPPAFDAAAAERDLLAFADSLPGLLRSGRLAEALEAWEALRDRVPAGDPLARSVREAGAKLLLMDRLYERAYGNAFILSGHAVRLPTVQGPVVEGTVEGVDPTGLTVRQRGIPVPVRFTSLHVDAVIALASADGTPASGLAAGATLILLGRAGEARAHLERAGDDPAARAFLAEIPEDAAPTPPGPGETPPAARDLSNARADEALARARRYHEQKQYRNVLRYMNEFLEAVDDDALAWYTERGGGPSPLRLVQSSRTECERCRRERFVRCPGCGGDGRTRLGRCGMCSATGRVECEECKARVETGRFRDMQDRIQRLLPPCDRCGDRRTVPCTRCEGSGQLRALGDQSLPCPACDGTGSSPCRCILER